MKIKVVSFNILCVDRGENYLIQDRAPRLYSVVAPFDPDVIGIQEYREQWEPYFNKYFSQYDMYNSWRSNDHRRESGPILWKRDKFELLDKGCFWYSDTPEVMSGSEWDEKFHCNRMCEYVKLMDKATGESFVFMNTHFGFGDNCQIKSAGLLTQYASRFSELPLFITGDFNMFTSYPAYDEMTKSFIDVNAATIKYSGNTYHAFGEMTENNGPIDFCFITDKVKPVSFKVIDDLVDGFYPSDHYGLFIELEI